MKISLNDDNLSVDVREILKDMQNVCEKEKKSLLNSIGAIIKKIVVKNMKFRSGINKSDYVHMQDDVNVSVKKNKYGNLFVLISGGKKTGYKWRFLNDGVIDNKGNVLVQGTHFMEKSTEDANNEIDKEVNSLLERVVNAGGR